MTGRHNDLRPAINYVTNGLDGFVCSLFAVLFGLTKGIGLIQATGLITKTTQNAENFVPTG